ncbi:UNVERIFIED_CONTAM: copS, partial [Trichonephila clavipes]
EHDACLTVQNTGDTIPEQHLPHLFERFYRVDGARQRTEEGVGLGLAITRSIVMAHQGSIEVSSQEGMTRFTIRLPTDDHGQEVFASGHDGLPLAALQTVTPGATLQAWSDGEHDYRLAVVDVAGPEHRWRVGIAINTLHHEVFLRAFERELFLIGVGGLVLMVALGWLAVRRGLMPLQRMAVVAEGISARHLQDRLSTTTVPVELETLASAFNAMLDRLSDSLDRLSAFSSDLAHELRTPVNNLMTQTQVLLSKPRSDEDYREVLYSNLEEFERLARMISDMLFLAKADNGLIMPHREAVQLASEVTAVLEFYEALAADKSLILQASGQAVVMGDALMLRRVISNLVSNAVRHAYPDT